MKFSAGILVCLCVIGLANIAPLKKADQDSIVGEHCWLVSGTIDGTTSSGMLRLYIIEVGGGHFLCSGLITITEPMVLDFTTFGNLVFMDNEIRGTLSVQGKHFDDEGNYTVGVDMYTFTLDPNTLNGTSEGIGIYLNRLELSEGNAIYTGCELPNDSN